jgi:hypothetical protein
MVTPVLQHPVLSKYISIALGLGGMGVIINTLEVVMKAETDRRRPKVARPAVKATTDVYRVR